MQKKFTIKFKLDNIEYSVSLLDRHLFLLSQHFGVEDAQLEIVQEKLAFYGIQPELPDLRLNASLQDLKAIFEAFLPSLMDCVDALPKDQKDALPDEIKAMLPTAKKPRRGSSL